MKIEFKRLTEINKTDIIDLMNDHLVRRQMPLLKGKFSKSDYHKFIVAKEQLWREYGYGPLAFIIDGKFAGWGGLQQEDGEVDLAMVLHPNYWGIGKILYEKIISNAFDEMGIDSVTVLFPPTRSRIKGLLRLGFKHDKEIDVAGQQFIRFRLENPQKIKNNYYKK